MKVKICLKDINKSEALEIGGTIKKASKVVEPSEGLQGDEWKLI